MLTHLYIPKLELYFSLDLPFSIEYMFIIFFPYLNSCKILPASINHPNFVFSISFWLAICLFICPFISLFISPFYLSIKQSKTLIKIKAKLQLIYLVILHLTKLVFSFLIDINCKCVFVYMFLLFVKGGTCLVSVIFICIDLGCPLKYG